MALLDRLVLRVREDTLVHLEHRQQRQIHLRIICHQLRHLVTQDKEISASIISRRKARQLSCILVIRMEQVLTIIFMLISLSYLFLDIRH